MKKHRKYSNYVEGTSPSIQHKRAKFDLSHTCKTAMNVGELIPFMIEEVLPGDTFKTKSHQVNRVTSSFVKAPMENLKMDTFYFYVPNRIIWDDWKYFQGQSKKAWYDENADYEIPQIKIPVGGITTGTIADYMGLPIGQGPNNTLPRSVSALPFRAFAKIYDDWFRNENMIDEMLIKTDDTPEGFNDNEWSPSNYLGKPPKIAKYKDYFTSCLPSQLKGEPVEINIGGVVPIKTSATETLTGAQEPLLLRNADGTAQASNALLGTNQGSLPTGALRDFGASQAPYAPQGPGLYPSNLEADLSQAQPIPITELRDAIQLNKMLERDARGGTRYTEIIQSHFGVFAGDARLNRAEFLGGSSENIHISQVVQTSAQITIPSQGTPTTTTPQANIAGYALNNGIAQFNKSFTEHGYIIGVCAIRQKHSYQQGTHKTFLRKKREDFYLPVFANISEQPVLTEQIYAFQQNKDKIFGYNEAWAEYRYTPNKITGRMRSQATDTLDIWHFGDQYDSEPVLSEEFTNETEKYVDRTLSVEWDGGSTNSEQFIVDFFINTSKISVMPLYSIPGLMDHN